MPIIGIDISSHGLAFAAVEQDGGAVQTTRYISFKSLAKELDEVPDDDEKAAERVRWVKVALDAFMRDYRHYGQMEFWVELPQASGPGITAAVVIALFAGSIGGWLGRDGHVVKYIYAATWKALLLNGPYPWPEDEENPLKGQMNKDQVRQLFIEHAPGIVRKIDETDGLNKKTRQDLLDAVGIAQAGAESHKRVKKQ